jgi:hypothetical protein
VKPPSKVEVGPMLTHEIQNDQYCFAWRAAQTAPELLNEHCGARGRAQHEDDINRRNVDALVEDIDGEDAPQLARSQSFDERPTLVRVGRADDDRGSKPARRESLGHVLGVVHRHAEAERPHPLRV